MINDVKGRDCMNTISFNVNNGGKIELTQREHDGSVMFTVDGKQRVISAGDFVMLTNYWVNCKNGTEKSNYIA